MKFHKEWLFLFTVIAGVILATQVLYIWSYAYGQPDHIFGGVLFNPYDGYSYFSKMYQGWQGSWKFSLPYTAEKSEGVFLFMFYILLGHIARWFSLPIPVVFHGARLASSFFLIVAIAEFVKYFYQDLTHRRWAILFSVLGSGFGWLALLFGRIAPDFWIAEIYPFLSMFANPHFPLGMALMIEIFILFMKDEKLVVWRRLLFLFLCSFILGLVLPFGVVLVVIITLGSSLIYFLVYAFEKNGFIKNKTRSAWQDSTAIILGGMPVLVYQEWVTLSNPLLLNWNQQNQTLAPSIYLLMIAISPAALFSIFGIINAIKRKNLETILLILWAGVGIGLAYLPFSLQRRFLLGVFIPISLLAILGIVFVSNYLYTKNAKKFANICYVVMLLLSLPTNVFLILSTRSAILRFDTKLFLQREEFDALIWIENNVPERSIILASPESSLYIPAFTGKGVVYGHPYETVNAEIKKSMVIDLFSYAVPENKIGLITQDAQSWNLDYIYWGPREVQLSNIVEPSAINALYEIVYRNREVSIYSCK